MKEEITDKCLREFLKKGIRKMTLKEIVAPLGISTKTVYKFFNSKEELLEDCLTLHYGRLAAGLTQIIAAQNNPVLSLAQIWIEAIRADFGTNHQFYHDLNYYYPTLQDKIIKKNRQSLAKPMLQMMQSGIEQGYFRDTLEPRVVLEAISVLYGSLTRTDQFKKYKLNPFVIGANTVEVYLRGLCTVKGLKHWDAHPSLTSFSEQKN